MKIFISYCHEDEAIAHLLGYILRQHKIECFIDRSLKAGTRFDTTLQEMIRSSDALLVLLTEAAQSSAWVNQEIGFAMACGKEIWPLVMAENVKLQGMLATFQWYSLFDWTNPERTVKSLVTSLKDAGRGIQNHDSHKKLGLDRVITGKIERTKFLIGRLTELLQQPARRITIFSQAAFSTFAVSNDPMYKEAGQHSDEYMGLLLSERQLFHQLVIRPTTTFKMLLWPVRSYDPKYLAIRFKALLAWMNEVQNLPNIDFLCTQYLGPNRVIVFDDFCLEGYKLHHTSGYEMSIVKYQPKKIENAVLDFETIFNSAHREGKSKDSAIQQVEAMYNNMSQLSGGKF